MSTHTGEMIRKYRIEKGLTQKKLGDLCGIADSNIRKYESGRQNPKFETLQKIAIALGVSALDLIPSDQVSLKKIDEDGTLTTIGKGWDAVSEAVRRKTKNNATHNNLKYIDLFSGSASLADEWYQKQQLKQLSDKIDEKMADSPITITAHFDGDEFTEEELEQIKKFAEFVKSQRKEKK